MDVISHAMVGAAMGEFARKSPRPLAGALFAFLPDALQALFLYPYVGFVHERWGFIPEHADWNGFRIEHPTAALWWEVPHSLFFWLLVVVPFCLGTQKLREKYGWLCAAAYLSHLLLDIPTHSGEWSVAPLWPLPLRIEGFTDPWRWPPEALALSIGITTALWLICLRVGRKGRPLSEPTQP